jgi:hypothetical protein
LVVGAGRGQADGEAELDRHLRGRMTSAEVPRETVVLPARVRNSDLFRQPAPDEMIVPGRY